MVCRIHDVLPELPPPILDDDTDMPILALG